MIPGVTGGKTQHASTSASFSYGRPPASTVRIIKFIATDGRTIAMLGNRQNTLTANSTNVYYTTDFGTTWSAVPGTPPSVNAFVAGSNNNMASILYADGRWIVGLGDSRVYYTTDLSTNWSSWTVGGDIDTTASTYGPLYYNGGLAAPYYIINDPNGGRQRIANEVTSWSSSSSGNLRTNTEAVVFGKLNGVSMWIGMSTNNIDKFTGGSATQMGSRSNMTTSGASGQRALVYWEEKGLWILSADNSLIYTSPDTGTDFSWTARTLNSTNDVTQLIVIPGVGVVAGTSPTANTASDNELGEIVFSKDGTTWTLLTQFNDSTRSYGFGYDPVLFNGSVLFPQSENSSGSNPITTSDGVNYKTILIADR